MSDGAYDEARWRQRIGRGGRDTAERRGMLSGSKVGIARRIVVTVITRKIAVACHPAGRNSHCR